MARSGGTPGEALDRASASPDTSVPIARVRQFGVLTHPLRLDPLDVLAAHGPSTAAECGRHLGAPQANCSFHLRQLARYALIEDAGSAAAALAPAGLPTDDPGRRRQ